VSPQARGGGKRGAQPAEGLTARILG